MFMGEYTHSIDNKGRLIIPAKFREQLGTRFVVTRGLDGCLFGYPASEWEQLQEKLKTLPLTKRDARAFVRFLYSAATDCEFDKQGRINLPETLRNHAKLEKKCVIVGVANRLEIWSGEKWSQFTNATEEDFDQIAEDLNLDF
ncbi:division/cell wall cluster transcriptional repressor MraZ [Lactobacillaceae bacterium 24-114]